MQQQIVQGDIKYQGEMSLIDQKTKSLLQEIFQTEPNLRVTIQDAMAHKFFMAQTDQSQSSYWEEIKFKSQTKVPF